MALYAKLHGVGINTPFRRKRLTDGKQEMSEMDLKALAKTMEIFSADCSVSQRRLQLRGKRGMTFPEQPIHTVSKTQIVMIVKKR